MTLTRLSVCLVVLGILLVPTPAARAGTITSVTQWGTPDPACTWEWATCAADPAFTPPTGGYRAGGSVSWDFVFDRSPFASVSSISLDVLVVGFWGAYPGNIDPAQGQMGDFLAVDGVPFAPFLDMTDGRDLRTFVLPTTFAAGPHSFSVVAYSDPSARYEGWAGVDYAMLTIIGESEVTPVPEPASLFLFGTGWVGLRAWRKR